MSAAHPHLLFIHGFPLEGSLWQPQMEVLDAVAHVLAPDLRGFGKDQREVPEVMAIADHAEDLKQLLDAQDVERVVLCGLSMGGYIALEFIARWPEQVEALVLCNTKATADDADARQARKVMARDAMAKGMSTIARAMAPKVLSRHSQDSDPKLVGRIRSMIAKQDPKAVAAAALGMAQRPDRMDLLPNIRVPALVITGSGDELMPLPTSEKMASAIPGGQLAVIPEAGHLSNIENPETFNALLMRFLGSLGNAGH